MSGSRPIITNSVVPMPRPPNARGTRYFFKVFFYIRLFHNLPGKDTDKVLVTTPFIGRAAPEKSDKNDVLSTYKYFIIFFMKVRHRYLIILLALSCHSGPSEKKKVVDSAALKNAEMQHNSLAGNFSNQ